MNYFTVMKSFLCSHKNLFFYKGFFGFSVIFSGIKNWDLHNSYSIILSNN